MNSTEWEITVHLNDFDEIWMRYATGMGSDIVILNSRFGHVMSISAVLRNSSEISIVSKIHSFYVIVFGIQNDAFNATELCGEICETLIIGKANLVVEMEPLQLPQPPSKFEFLEYLKFEYLEINNRYWPTLLAEFGYAATLAGLETLLAEPIDVYQDITLGGRNKFCLIGDIGEFCFESTLAELKLLAEYGYEPTLADIETSPYLLQWFEKFQSEELRKSIFFEEYFLDNWRSGQEVHKIVITQRLYQTSPNSTQD